MQHAVAEADKHRQLTVHFQHRSAVSTGDGTEAEPSASVLERVVGASLQPHSGVLGLRTLAHGVFLSYLPPVVLVKS
jgi:hypothetical protein